MCICDYSRETRDQIRRNIQCILSLIVIAQTSAAPLSHRRPSLSWERLAGGAYRVSIWLPSTSGQAVSRDKQLAPSRVAFGPGRNLLFNVGLHPHVSIPHRDLRVGSCTPHIRLGSATGILTDQDRRCSRPYHASCCSRGWRQLGLASLEA
jgi:hypothetical protein